jgi:hypothetical protein
MELDSTRSTYKKDTGSDNPIPKVSVSSMLDIRDDVAMQE